MTVITVSDSFIWHPGTKGVADITSLCRTFRESGIYLRYASYLPLQAGQHMK
ncbi:hypothetical protein N836_32305 [Leptolyngbya sp. Heron Island J]|uniref:hypothetical protein n=1 Tax=Leptolyngbya sp. Heron Island J TaxID=1385935 RepID=UPI0003B966B4|nr:hypothetical protein [Leptolyngbya sp. Heron Island J]ESA38624.1 hypothetical protein N836_32305 [Leptolyngbya sp. Heron Island J]